MPRESIANNNHFVNALIETKNFSVAQKNCFDCDFAEKTVISLGAGDSLCLFLRSLDWARTIDVMNDSLQHFRRNGRARGPPLSLLIKLKANH